MGYSKTSRPEFRRTIKDVLNLEPDGLIIIDCNDEKERKDTLYYLYAERAIWLNEGNKKSITIRTKNDGGKFSIILSPNQSLGGVLERRFTTTKKQEEMEDMKRDVELFQEDGLSKEQVIKLYKDEGKGRVPLDEWFGS